MSTWNPGAQPDPYGPPPQQPGYGQQPPQYGQPGYGQPPNPFVPPPGYAEPAYGQPYGAYPGAPVPPPALGYGGGPVTPFGLPASMGNRLLARIIDGLIVGVPAAIVIGLLVANVVSNTDCTTDEFGATDCTTTGAGLGALVVGYVLVLLASLFYELWFIGRTGATPGKRLLGITVVDEQTGGPIGMARAFIRALVLGVTGQLCLLGYLSPFFDGTKRNQGWHDKAATDFVVSTR